MALVVVGAFVVLSCLLALWLEADGFGRPRDTSARPGYVASLIVGIAAAIVVPAVVCRMLLVRWRGAVYAVSAAVASLAAVAILGITR